MPGMAWTADFTHCQWICYRGRKRRRIALFLPDINTPEHGHFGVEFKLESFFGEYPAHYHGSRIQGFASSRYSLKLTYGASNLLNLLEFDRNGHLFIIANYFKVYHLSNFVFVKFVP